MHLPTSMVVELNKSLQMGIPWRVALAEITEGTDMEHVAAFVDDTSLANWIWLVDFGRRDRALDVCGGDGTMTASLARHFAAVYFLEPDHSLLSFSQKRFAQDGIGNVVLLSASEQDLPFRHGSFDCIVLHEVFDRYGLPAGRAQTDSDHRALLTACHRLLRPGGYLCVGATNPYWHGNLRNGPGGAGLLIRIASTLVALIRKRNRIASCGGLARLLHEVGFHGLRSHYVAPSVRQPRSIIPTNRRAVVAYEASTSAGGAKATLRRLLASLGLHFFLFPSQLILANR